MLSKAQKRFDQAVDIKVQKELLKLEYQRRLWKTENQIRKLYKEIKALREEMNAIKPAGQIRGYYKGSDGQVIICEGKGKEDD